MNTSRIIMGSTCSMQRHPDEYNRSSSKKNSSRGNVSGSYIYLYLHIFGRVRVHISHFDSHSDSSLLLLPSIRLHPTNYQSTESKFAGICWWWYLCTEFVASLGRFRGTSGVE